MLSKNDQGATIYLLGVWIVVALFLWILRKVPADAPLRMWLRIGWLLAFGTVWLFTIGLSSYSLWLVLLAVQVFVFRDKILAVYKKLPVLAWLLLLALVVRIPGMFEPLWYDETFSAVIAARPFPLMIEAALGDVHPPLWYSILWLVQRVLGNAEWALRLPALAFGMGSLYVLWLLVKEKLGEHVALWAVGITSVLPMHIYYSHEARPYAMLMFSVWLAMYSIHTDRRRLFALMAATAALSHNLGYIYAAVLCVYGWMRWGARKWNAPIALTALFAYWWIPGVVFQSVTLKTEGWWLRPLDWGIVLQPVIFAAIFQRMQEHSLLVYTLVIFTLLGFALIQNKGAKRMPFIWWTVAVGVPALVLVVSVLYRNVYLHRAMAPSMVLFVVVPIAYWLVNAYHADRRVAVMMLVPVLAVGIADYYTSGRHRLPVREPLAAACAGADAIYNSSIEMHIMTVYHSDIPSYLWKDAASYQMQTINDSRRWSLGWNEVYLEELTGKTVCFMESESGFIPAEQREYVQRVLGNAERHVMMDTGHMRMSATIIEVQ